MIQFNKMDELKEQFTDSEQEITFKEFVENKAASDPHFFDWLFDEKHKKESNLTEKQKLEFTDFLNQCIE